MIATFTGEEIKIGADEQYRAACKSCFYQFKWELLLSIDQTALSEEVETLLF